MNDQHVKYNFVHLNPVAKADFADVTVTKMTTNVAKFPSPKVPLATITADAIDLRAKQAAHIANPKGTDQDLINSETKMNKDLRSNGRYVDLEADGDGAVIDLSGYEHHTGVHTPKHITAQPTKVEISNLGGLMLECTCAPVDEADTYVGILQKTAWQTPIFNDHQIGFATPNVNPFFIDISTKREKVFKNLDKGAEYFYGVCCINSAGISVLSIVVDKIATS